MNTHVVERVQFALHCLSVESDGVPAGYVDGLGNPLTAKVVKTTPW